MKSEFPAAVPEIPVGDRRKAIAYYVNNLGFNLNWDGEDGGIAGISRGQCRLFLTDPGFREMYGNLGPVLIWLNLSSREEVNELHAQWSAAQARIISPPESKPWKLHEFTAADLDGNLLRVFYDFAWETRS
jgi:predicted lactoylglutathione lyase